MPSSTGTVTSVQPSPGARKAVDIYVDEDFWRRTNKRAAVAVGLRTGEHVNPAVIADLDDQERKLAEEFSLSLLSYRSRSVAEIRRKLAASGLAPEAVDAQVDRLARAGYLDDADFARAWIDERVRIKNYGRRRIASELISRGVDPALFQPNLDAACSEHSELERAISLLDRRFPQRPGADAAREKRRAYSWLVRRGFSGGTVRSALQSAELGNDPPDCP